MTTLSGQCLCGQVRLSVRGEPLRVGICHCTDCQTLTGTAFRVTVPAARESFTLLKGAPRTYLKTTAESGSLRVQAFCDNCGTPIYAAAEGKVLWAKYLNGFGNQVMVDHGYVKGNSLMTSYNHLSKFAVHSGQYVSRGQVVGYSGNEGLSLGCHLHFEVYVNGHTVNPMSILGPIP